jgi:recombinational DNA repair protein RecT
MLGQAYLVPYGKRAQLIIGYRGMLALARRSGDIVSIDAHVVHENDKFEASYGTDGRLHHEQCLTGDPGKVICAYAYARLKDGGYAYDVLPLSELERIRRSSAAASSGPWKSWPEEMMRKSAVKRLCKYLPLSVELAEILLRDGRHEAGLAPEIDIEATVAEEPKTKIEQITERLNSETETVINVEATKQNIPGAETQVVSTDILVRCKKHNDVDAENGCWKCAAEKEEQAEGEKAKKAQARPKQSKLDVD